ncbi:hypothetical protein C5167_009761 [Papaver somniferum]|uniref:Uncharacterized protein n=1 Tax=Papaver somniferum TaxID=3469 RepID=A0A4Y7K2B9_PAPSO|nr:uncharacterized protein LOC113288353 [Papaver somniferum]RZC66059.1 hypothetical protein C5167_009761 [Papaver somniferum]
MASSAYPVAVFRHEQGVYYKSCKDLRSVVPVAGSRQDMLRADGLNLMPFHPLEDSRGHMGWSSDSNQYVKLEPAMRRPVLVDVRRQDSEAIFNYGIAERDSTEHEKHSQFFMSRSRAAAEAEREGANSPFAYHLMSRLQALPITISMHPRPLTFLSDEVSVDDVGAFDQFHPSLVYPDRRLYALNPLSDFVGDLSSDSRISMHPDGRVLFSGSGVEMKDLRSIIAEFSLSSTSTKRGELPFLVPHFTRLITGEAARANVCEAPLKLEAVMVAPAKSPKRTKIKQSPTKRSNCRKAGNDGDIRHRRNDFQACESLLSLILGKRQGKTAIQSLKNSAPELPQLLTQFSSSIAGTGLVVLLYVVFKVFLGRLPFCTSKMLNTGFGFGLVWLSWAVNQLRESVISISKNPNNKLGLQDENLMKKVDTSVNEIFFRAAMVMAVAVLKIA